jgi:hypothetical protein
MIVIIVMTVIASKLLNALKPCGGDTCFNGTVPCISSSWMRMNAGNPMEALSAAVLGSVAPSAARRVTPCYDVLGNAHFVCTLQVL